MSPFYIQWRKTAKNFILDIVELHKTGIYLNFQGKLVDLGYADDIGLLAILKEYLELKLSTLVNESCKAGLKINVTKTNASRINARILPLLIIKALQSRMSHIEERHAYTRILSLRYLITGATISKLKAFVNRCLKERRKIWWSRRISYEHLCKSTGQRSIEKEIMKGQYRWLDHMLKKNIDVISHSALRRTPQGN